MTIDTCGGMIPSRRGLLASIWSLVTTLTVIAFITASTFTFNNNSGSDSSSGNYNNYNNEEDDRHENYKNMQPAMALTSRAMAIAGLWTAVMAILMAVFGAVVLGWQSPIDCLYYTCCSPAVHQTSPLALGTLIGALLMFANLTLVCSVLFGEFQIRDFDMEDHNNKNENQNNNNNNALRTTILPSRPFSIMCACLTVLYAGFGVLVFYYSPKVLTELNEDSTIHKQQQQQHYSHHPHHLSSKKPNGGGNAYMERFDIRPNTFVAPTPVPQAVVPGALA